MTNKFVIHHGINSLDLQERIATDLQPIYHLLFQGKFDMLGLEPIEYRLRKTPNSLYLGKQIFISRLGAPNEIWNPHDQVYPLGVDLPFIKNEISQFQLRNKLTLSHREDSVAKNRRKRVAAKAYQVGGSR